MERVIFDGSAFDGFKNGRVVSEEFTVNSPVLVTMEGGDALKRKGLIAIFALQATEQFEHNGEPFFKDYFFPCTQCEYISERVLPKGLYASNPSFYIDNPKNTTLRFVAITNQLFYGHMQYVDPYYFEEDYVRDWFKDVKITIREVEKAYINNLWDLGCPEACPELATVPIEEHTIMYDKPSYDEEADIQEGFCIDWNRAVSKIVYDSVTGDVVSVEYDDSYQLEEAWERVPLTNLPTALIEWEGEYGKQYADAIHDECISEPPCVIKDIILEAKEPDPVPPDVTVTTTQVFCTGGYSDKAYRAGMVAVKMDSFDEAYVDTLDDLDPSLLTVEVPMSVIKELRYYGGNFVTEQDEEIIHNGVQFVIDEQRKAYLMPFFTNGSDFTMHDFVKNHKMYLPFFKNSIDRYKEAATIVQFDDSPDAAMIYAIKHVSDGMLSDTQASDENYNAFDRAFPNIGVYYELYENYGGFTVDFTPIPPVEYCPDLHSYVEAMGTHTLITLLAVPMADGRYLFVPVPISNDLIQFAKEQGSIHYGGFDMPAGVFEAFERYIEILFDEADFDNDGANGNPYAIAMIRWWYSNMEMPVLPPICLVSTGNK